MEPYIYAPIFPNIVGRIKLNIFILGVDRPGQALMFPGGSGSQISRQSAHEGGKVVSPRHRLPLSQEIFLVLISVRG
jgi:hypothetical protein